MRFLLATMVFLVSMSVQASAQSNNKRTVLEFSSTKCETWTDRRLRAARFADASHMESWAFGFVSGVNLASNVDRESTDFLRNVDTNEVGIWLDDHCRAHPLEGFVDAVRTLASELRKRTYLK